MKQLIKTIILSVLVSFGAVCSAQQPPQGGGMGMEHDMGGMDPAKMTEHFKKMQEHMLVMHDLSNKILAETDPAKKQALKDQQLELMKAHHMEMMSKHHGKGMDHKKMQ